MFRINTNGGEMRDIPDRIIYDNITVTSKKAKKDFGKRRLNPANGSRKPYSEEIEAARNNDFSDSRHRKEDVNVAATDKGTWKIWKLSKIELFADIQCHDG